MQLDHFMTREIEAVEALTTVQETVDLMHQRDIHFLPVHLEGGLIGVVTQRDIETRTRLAELNPKESAIAEIMTAVILTCSEKDTAETALELMNQHNVRRLIVTNHEQHVVGIVSLSDLALPQALNSLKQADELTLLAFPVQNLQQKDYAL
jgi:CBS domain-containing protein